MNMTQEKFDALVQSIGVSNQGKGCANAHANGEEKCEVCKLAEIAVKNEDFMELTMSIMVSCMTGNVLPLFCYFYFGYQIAKAEAEANQLTDLMVKGASV